MIYGENVDAAKRYKEEYVEGFDRIIIEREAEGAFVRDGFVKKIFADQQGAREEFKKMLGWPLCEDRGTITEPETEKLFEQEEYTIYRMRFEILAGLKLTGLFFKKNDDKERPLIIVQHGGLGSPELMSGFYNGDSSNYNDVSERVLKFDVNIFAPQLILWNEEYYGVEHKRREIDARLKRVGSSVTAVEIYGIQKIIDYFEQKPYVKNFGMIGLSYGGFYTLFTTACEVRIKSAISCSFFNDREKYAWSDWTWNNSAYSFSDAEIACLVYPRHLCIEVGDQDELFDIESAHREFDRLKKHCAEVGTEWVDFVSFNGGHEFCHSDEPIKRLVDDLV